MPANDSNALILRAGRYWLPAYMSIMTGDLIWEGEVSATPTPHGALNLAVTETSGDAADIRRGMRVVVESSTGKYKGTISIRRVGTISSTNIPVREVSVMEVGILAGDVIKVYEDVIPVDILPRATETFDPDSEAYTNQNSNPPPICTSGGSWAGWLTDAAAGIPFDGSESYVVDPDSGGDINHLWTTAGGTIDDDTSATPLIEYAAAGKYAVQHDAEDDDNSKIASQYLRVRVHDEADPPIRCLVSWELNPETGFNTRLTVFDALPLSVLPDNARVIVWTDRPIAGTHKTGRDHILADGYVRRDVSDSTYREKSLELEIASPLQKLSTIPGFSKVFERNQTPDAWHKVKSLTVKRAMIMLARVYTNICDLHDFVFDGFDDADYSLFYIQKQVPYQQLNELADSRGGRVTCDLTGRIEVQGRLELCDYADRAAIPTTLTITGSDTSRIRVEREHEKPLETLRVRGFSAGNTANQPLFARAPATPGRGTQEPTQERFIFDDVPHLYQQTAMRAAALNRVFFKLISGADYEQHHAPRITLTMPGSYWGLFQNYREWFEFDIAETSNLREVDLSAFRWQVISANVTVGERGVAEVQAQLQAETFAPQNAAVDDTPKQTPSTPTNPDPGPVNPTIPSPSFGVPVNTRRIVMITDTGKIIRTDNFGYGAGTYWVIGDLGFAVADAVADAFCPAYYEGSGTVDGWIATAGATDAIQRIENLFGTVILSPQKSLGAALAANRYRLIESNWGAPGHVVVVSHYYNASGFEGTWYTYSTDARTGGTYSTETNIEPHFHSTGNFNGRPGLWLSPRNIGAGITSAFSAAASTPSDLAKFYALSSAYATLTQVSSPAGYKPGQVNADGGIHVPYDQPGGAESVVCFGLVTATGTPDAQTWRKNADGSLTNISPTITGDSLRPYMHRAFYTFPLDSRFVIMVGRNNALTKSGVFTSTDGGTTMTQISAGTTTDYRCAALSGNDPNMGFVWGADGAIGIVRNLSEIIDQRGNLVGMSGLGNVLNIMGG